MNDPKVFESTNCLTRIELGRIIQATPKTAEAWIIDDQAYRARVTLPVLLSQGR